VEVEEAGLVVVLSHERHGNKLTNPSSIFFMEFFASILLKKIGGRKSPPKSTLTISIYFNPIIFINKVYFA